MSQSWGSTTKKCLSCWYLGHVDDHCSKCYKKKDDLCHPICRNFKSDHFDHTIKDPRLMSCARHSTVKTSDAYVLHGVEWQEELEEKDKKGGKK